MKKQKVSGAQLPKADDRVHWVETVEANSKCKITCYSPAIVGVYTHYHEGRKASTPCYADHGHCMGGHDPATIRWKGYIFGWLDHLNRVGFLQLTEKAARGLLDQLGEITSLRGLKIEAKRTQKKNGRLYASVLEYLTRDPASVPPDQHPRHSLYNTWKLKDPGWEWATDPDREWVLSPEGYVEPGVLIHPPVILGSIPGQVG